MIDRVHKFVSTTFHVIAIVLTTLIVIPAGAFIFWAADRDFPISNVETQFIGWSPTNPRVALISWKADRSRLCQGKAYRWMFAGHHRNLPPVEMPPPGAVKAYGETEVEWTEEVHIPEDVANPPFDSAAIYIRVTWQCNPLHEWWPLVYDPPPVTISLPRKTP